jgi:hypothetical protein
LETQLGGELESCTPLQLELGSSEFDALTAALEVGLSLMLGLPRNGIHDSLINV